MSQYYYILNSRPNKPKMRPVNTRTGNPCKALTSKVKTVVKEEVKVEEMPEFDIEVAKKHLQPLQQDAVAEPTAEAADLFDITPEVVEETADIIKEAMEETPKKKRRGRKKAEEVEEEIEA